MVTHAMHRSCVMDPLNHILLDSFGNFLHFVVSSTVRRFTKCSTVLVEKLIISDLSWLVLWYKGVNGFILSV
jgi:hypothetical protein